MQERFHDSESLAERLVLGVIAGGRARVATRAQTAAQELPDLGQVGAAVARAARIAAACHRAFLPYPIGACRRQAGFLEPDEAERKALFADLASDEGVLLPDAGPRTGFVWRLHPDPCGAGAPVAPHPADPR